MCEMIAINKWWSPTVLTKWRLREEMCSARWVSWQRRPLNIKINTETDSKLQSFNAHSAVCPSAKRLQGVTDQHAAEQTDRYGLSYVCLTFASLLTASALVNDANPEIYWGTFVKKSCPISLVPCAEMFPRRSSSQVSLVDRSFVSSSIRWMSSRADHSTWEKADQKLQFLIPTSK